MAAQQTRFVGIYEHGLDEKGRMVLPSKIRALLGETGMVGMLDGCLGLWTLEGFDAIADDFATRVEAQEAPMRDFRVFMAYAAEVTPDQQGRVVIPQRLRDYAKLGSEVVVSGRRDRAEIWDRAAWDELAHSAIDGPATSDEEADADLASTMAALRL